MSGEQPHLYELLVLDNPPTPPRSRLYHLEPIGIGTPLTESFTSYLTRLAYAHGVGPWTLIEEEILSVAKQEHLTGGRGIWGDRARALNSVGNRAHRWVEAVSYLTSRQDLTWLTMLPWKHVVSFQNLVRGERAWCPQCLRDWRVSCREVYEPLLWALQGVSVCPIHEDPLQSYCPHGDCGRRSHPLHAHQLAGRCSHCLRWLDHQEERRPSHRSHDQVDRAQAVRAAKAVGELLAAAPTLHPVLGRDRVAQALRRLCQAVAQGNVSAMARLANFPRDILGCWMRGSSLPQLNSLVQFCDRIGTTPLGLLKDGGHGPDILRSHPDKSLQPLRVGRRRWAPFPVATVRSALEAVLADRQSPPPSLEQVAEQLGYHSEHLWTRFPGLCRTISARYRQDRADRSKKRLEALKADVHRATQYLVRHGLNPSRYQVERYLEKPGIFWDPGVQEAWRTALKELGVT